MKLKDIGSAEERVFQNVNRRTKVIEDTIYMKYSSFSVIELCTKYMRLVYIMYKI